MPLKMPANDRARGNFQAAETSASNLGWRLNKTPSDIVILHISAYESFKKSFQQQP